MFSLSTKYNFVLIQTIWDWGKYLNLCKLSVKRNEKDEEKGKLTQKNHIGCNIF